MLGFRSFLTLQDLSKVYIREHVYTTHDLNNRLFINQIDLDHLNTKLVCYSDPHSKLSFAQLHLKNNYHSDYYQKQNGYAHFLCVQKSVALFLNKRKSVVGMLAL